VVAVEPGQRGRQDPAVYHPHATAGFASGYLNDVRLRDWRRGWDIMVRSGLPLGDLW